MFLKSEKQEIYDEIRFNKAVDNQTKRENNYLGSIFKKRNDEIPAINELNAMAVNHRQMDMKLIQLKRLLLVMAILTLTLVSIFVISRIEFNDQYKRANDLEKLMDNNVENNISNYDMLIKLNEIKYNESLLTKEIEIQTQTETSTTLTTTVTTTQTTIMTTRKPVEHILVTIIVNRATVPRKDYTYFSGDSDAYVVLYLDGIKIGSTNAIQNTNNPQWNYHFMQQIKLSVNSIIYFEIYDKEKYSKDEYIGGLTVKISKLMAYKLNGKINSEYYGSGTLWYTVSWVEL